MSGDSISVIVPVYNSEASLPALLARLHPVLRARGVSFEIVLVNDDSRDQSWKVIRGLAADYPEVRGLDLSRNYGQHNALLCGIRAARHALIVTIDDDLQHPPEQIPALLDKLAEGHDVVYGTPRRERHGWWRDGSSVLTKLVLRHVMGLRTARDVSAFRAFRARLRQGFDAYRSPHVAIDVLLSWVTTRFAAVTVPHDRRQVGRSNYTFRKLVRYALNLTTGFSTAPLRLASLVGFAVTLLGVAVLFGVIGRYLVEGDSVPGFPFLASIIAIFSGTQMFTLGIFGEYLARIHVRTLEQPTYIVRGVVPTPADPE